MSMYKLYLDEIDLKFIRNILKNYKGIYSFYNIINHNQYIASVNDFYLRFNEHINNKKSNNALQRAFNKYGLHHFEFHVYFQIHSSIETYKNLTDLETEYIGNFDFNTLYNYKRIATSMLGYKHTDQAREKW